MTDKARMRITADKHPWSRCIELRAGVESGSGFQVVETVSMSDLPDGQAAEPFMRLKPEEAQHLMDELWQCGIRPSQEEGSTGQAAAMKSHLDDMRAIAFHALKVKS